MLWSQSNGTEETSTLAVLLEPRWLDQKILDVYSKLNDSMKLIRSDAETQSNQHRCLSDHEHNCKNPRGLKNSVKNNAKTSIRLFGVFHSARFFRCFCIPRIGKRNHDFICC